jgi:hypothetical protein
VQSTYIAIYSFIYIHCNLFIHLHILQSIHSFIYSTDQKKVYGELTSVCQWWRFLCARGRAMAAVEDEADSSGIDDGRGDRVKRC